MGLLSLLRPLAPDAVSSASSAATATLNWLHTVGANGANRLMTIRVIILNALSQTASTVKFNAVGATFVTAATNGTGARVEIWRLFAPATGTHTVLVTLSASATVIGIARSWVGADQTTGIGHKVTATGTSAAPSATLTSAKGRWVEDGVGSATTLVTAGSGQTQDAKIGVGGLEGAGSRKPGDTPTVTMSWTATLSVSWAQAVVEIQPVGAAAVGGQTYLQTLAGASTPGGSVVNKVIRSLTGSGTPAASIANRAIKLLVGAAGSPAGALKSVGIKPLVGAGTPAASIVNRANKPTAGASTPSGADAQRAVKQLVGSESPTAIVVRSPRRLLSGSLGALVGALVLRPGKAEVGSITPSATLIELATRLLQGLSAPGGIAIERPARSFTGASAPSGAEKNQTQKKLLGNLGPTGTAVERVNKKLAGLESPAAAVIEKATRVLIGAETIAGGLRFQAQKNLAGLVANGLALRIDGGYATATIYRTGPNNGPRVIVHCTRDDWTAAGQFMAVEGAWYFETIAGGGLRFRHGNGWTMDVAAPGFANGSDHWLRADSVWLLVSYTDFYISSDGVNWTYLARGTTGAYLLSLGTAGDYDEIRVGDGATGYCFYASWEDGYLLASPDFTVNVLTPFNDAEGNEWNLVGAASINSRPISGVLRLRSARSFSGIEALVGIEASMGRLHIGGTESSVGSVSELPKKMLAGIVGPGGSITERAARLMSGSEMPTGIASQLASRAFAGLLNPAGTAAEMALLKLVGASTPTGAIATSYLASSVLSGALSPSASLTLLAQVLEQGNEIPTGVATQLASFGLAGEEISNGELAILAAISLSGETNSTQQLLVAVGLHLNGSWAGIVLTSGDNGATWATHSTPLTFVGGAASNGSRLVIAGLGPSGGIAAYTDDGGITWTESANKPLGGGVVYGLFWLDNQFIAVGSNYAGGFAIATSPNGVTWTGRTSALTYYAQGVGFDGSRLAAGGTGLVTSDDHGLTWDSQVIPLSYVWSLGFDGEWWVAVGTDLSFQTAVARSLDAVSWEQIVLPITAQSGGYAALEFSAELGRWVYGDRYLLTSDDHGATWTQQTTPMDGLYIYGAKWDGVRFTVVGGAGGSSLAPHIMDSLDGFTWTAETDPYNGIYLWLYAVVLTTVESNLVGSLSNTPFLKLDGDETPVGDQLSVLTRDIGGELVPAHSLQRVALKNVLGRLARTGLRVAPGDYATATVMRGNPLYGGFMSLRVCVALDDWDAGGQDLMSLFAYGTYAQLQTLPGGGLRLHFHESVTLSTFDSDLPGSLDFASGSLHWIRLDVAISHSEPGSHPWGSFYKSDDGVVWTYLGTGNAGGHRIEAGQLEVRVGGGQTVGRFTTVQLGQSIFSSDWIVDQPDFLNNISAPFEDSYGYTWSLVNGSTLDPVATLFGRLQPRVAKIVKGNEVAAGLAKQLVVRKLGGTETPTGTVARAFPVLIGGSLASVGLLTSIVEAVLSGHLSSEGSLRALGELALSGSEEAEGAIANLVSFVESGLLLGSGNLVREVMKSEGGDVVSSGSLIREALMSIDGEIAASGQARFQADKTLSGSSEPFGNLAKESAIGLSGAIDLEGSTVNLVAKAVTAEAEVTGAVRNLVQQSEVAELPIAGRVFIVTIPAALHGTLESEGTLRLLGELALSGLVAPTGTLATRAFILLVGEAIAFIYFPQANILIQTDEEIGLPHLLSGHVSIRQVDATIRMPFGRIEFTNRQETEQ